MRSGGTLETSRAGMRGDGTTGDTNPQEGPLGQGHMHEAPSHPTPNLHHDKASLGAANQMLSVCSAARQTQKHSEEKPQTSPTY